MGADVDAVEGFALPVLCTNTGAVDVPVFSYQLAIIGRPEVQVAHYEVGQIACERHTSRRDAIRLYDRRTRY